MAKGKSSNPMDAYRKAQRAKELKKNKETRTKAKEVATLKKDVGPLEAEVRKLAAAEQSKTLDKNGQARLAELRAEVVRIKKAKEEYVAAHPEHRKFVYAHEEAREQARKTANAGEGSSSGAYDKLGRLRDPTRSVYYDPVLNPFGVPPPGMPYMEKPREEVDTDEEGSSDEDDSDDDIEMPEGPPPGAEQGNESDSDDSIVMPEGTPPPEAKIYPAAPVQQPPPMPPLGMAPTPGFPLYPPSPFPMGYQGQFAPPVTYGQSQFQQQPYPPGNGFIQAPPRNFFPGNPGNQHHRPGPGGNFRPPPATAGLPARPVNDPLSDVPHQTFQAHRQARREEAEREIQGTPDQGEKTAAPPASAEISAAPQLRDLRKEAAIFVPRVAKKKKTAAGTTVITAAPVVSDEKSDASTLQESGSTDNYRGNGPAIQSAPQSAPPVYNPAIAAGGLMSKLSGVLGTPAVSAAPKERADDYKTFLAGLDKLDH